MAASTTAASFFYKALIILLIFVAVIVSVSTIVVWQYADNLVHPPQRVLQDYHHYWLTNAAVEGVEITSFDCAGGLMPCLFVTPQPHIQTLTAKNDNAAGLGHRGVSIRQQLEQDFGHNLAPYTESINQPKGIVMLLHGRAGRKEDLLPVAARLVASGFVCVLVDLPAHGDSPLLTSNFGAELANLSPDMVTQSLSDMRSWLQRQQAQQPQKEVDVSTLPAFIWGMSMGGSYSNYTLGQSKDKRWQGVVIVSSFADLEGVIKAQTNQFVAWMPQGVQRIVQPVLLSTFEHFVEWQGGTAPSSINPAEAVSGVDIPILQFHGDQDHVINIRQGKRLHNSYATSDKTWVTVAGAAHNNVLVTDAPVYAITADWLLNRVEKGEAE